MKKWKIITIAAVAVVVAMVLFATVGLQEALNVTIGSVDLSTIADGRYVGEYRNGRFSSTVAVTVQNHAITGVEAIKGSNAGATMIAELAGRVLAAQQPNVDAFSGATATSKSFLKAVENALTAAAGQ